MSWRIIRFQYRGTERVALEIEGDNRQINAMHCLQSTKDGETEVGFRSFKVPEMRDIQPVENAAGYLQENPDFLRGVQEVLEKHDESSEDIQGTN